MIPDQLKTLTLLASANGIHGWTCRQIGLALGKDSQWAIGAIRPLMNGEFVEKIEGGYRITVKGREAVEGGVSCS